MATSNKPDPVSKTPQSSGKANQSSSASTPHSSKSLLLGVVFIIALIAMGIAIYTTTQTIKLASQTETLVSELDKTNQDRSRIKKSLQSLNDAQSELAETVKTTDKTMQSALKQHRYQSNDWVLLKARYYLQLAQINAHWSDNLETTITLLQQADESLSGLHDQRLFKIRQVIAQEIAKLKTMPSVDITGILSELDALQTAITALPVKRSTLSAADEKNTPAESPSLSTWNARLKTSVDRLKQLVIVRRHDEAIKPMLSEEQESMLRQSIILNLQIAQWAVLQQNESVYKMVLNKATKSIKHHFTDEKALTEQLDVLKKMKLKQQKPDINQSLSLLNQLIETNISKPIEPTTTGETS